MAAGWINGPGAAMRAAAAGLAGLVRLRPLLRAPDLRIQAAAGASGDALIVFNSLHAKTAGEAPAEFLATASAGGARHVLFVTDPLQRWFQGADVARRVVGTIRDYLAETGARPRLTLGVSTGGYAAAVFAAPIGARAALCIGAQYDVGPDSPEKSWKAQRAAIDAFRLGPAGGHIDGATALTTLHGGRDRWHADRFARRNGVSAWMAPTQKHNVAGLLKERGLLAPLVNAAARDDRVEISRLMSRFGAERIAA